MGSYPPTAGVEEYLHKSFGIILYGTFVSTPFTYSIFIYVHVDS